MDYESDNENQEGTSLMDRLKESPRTVSALIIILIVAAAIYAFSGDDGQQTEELLAEDAAVTEQTEDASQEEGEDEEETVDSTETSTEEGAVEEIAVATPEPVTAEVLAAQTERLPEATKTDSGYIEKATAGDGVTHLTRRATTRYLSENTPEYAVTNEHRIYIEDYLRRKIGSHGLSVGAEHTISYELIEEAVAAAGNLTPAQLNNLTQYASVLR